MEKKKIIGAIVAGILLLAVGRHLMYSVWLASSYIEGGPWRTEMAFRHRIWVMHIADLVYATASVLIYLRGREAKPWLGQGLRFGILLAMATVVPQSLVEYVVYPIHHLLVIKWIIWEGALAVLFGVIIAAICRPKPVAS